MDGQAPPCVCERREREIRCPTPRRGNPNRWEGRMRALGERSSGVPRTLGVCARSWTSCAVGKVVTAGLWYARKCAH